MNTSDFVHKVNLRRVNTMLRRDNWDAPFPVMTWTRFVPMHRVGRGRNGASTLLQFVTEKHEIERVQIVRQGKRLDPYVSIYVRYRSTAGQMGFRDSKVFLLTVVKDGKTDYVHFAKTGSCNDNYAFFQMFDDLWKQAHKEHAWCDVETLADRPLDAEYLQTNTVKMGLERNGYQLIDVMRYDERLWVGIEYVLQTSTRIEIGYHTNDTYNSLPQMIRFDTKEKVKTVSLAEMGVEQPGYYDHHDRMEVLAVQVDEVKAFAKRFERKQKEATQEVTETTQTA